MTFKVAHWDALDDSLTFSMQGTDNCECTNGKCHVFYIFSIQEEDILEHTNGKCHLCTL